MRTVTVTLEDDSVMPLLRELERLRLLRVNEPEATPVVKPPVDYMAKYEGKMTAQSEEEIEQQLRALRDEWNRDWD